MNEFIPQGSPQNGEKEKAKRVKEAKQSLSKAQRALEVHLTQCPGDHFWAHGDEQRYKQRHKWLLKKDELEYRVLQATGHLETAQSLWVVGWAAQKAKSLYNQPRVKRVKEVAA